MVLTQVFVLVLLYWTQFVEAFSVREHFHARMKAWSKTEAAKWFRKLELLLTTAKAGNIPVEIRFIVHYIHKAKETETFHDTDTILDMYSYLYKAATAIEEVTGYYPFYACGTNVVYNESETDGPRIIFECHFKQIPGTGKEGAIKND